MRESYDEGVASHIGPESCGGSSNAMAEALTGVRAGQVLSREMLVNSGVLTIWVRRTHFLASPPRPFPGRGRHFIHSMGTIVHMVTAI